MRATQRRKWLLFTVLALASTSLAATSILPSHAANGSVAYTYDALGRVTTASYDTGVCIIYSYDANGNRTTQTIQVSTSGSTGVWGCFNWNERNWGN